MFWVWRHRRLPAVVERDSLVLMFSVVKIRFNVF
jgi:hypothetical protein